MLKIALIFFCLIICILYAPGAYIQDTDPWRLKKRGNNVAVYTRNSGKSAFKEVRVETQLKTSLSSIVGLLNDWESYPQWVYKCKSSKTLKKISETRVIHYQTMITPWPMENRDFVVDVEFLQDAKTKTVIQKSKAIPDYIPEEEGYVRIRELEAYWIIAPLKNGMVNVVYQLLVDPGGNIPASIENLATTEGPYQTMINLRQWVMKEKYQKSVLPFIEEPERELESTNY